MTSAAASGRTIRAVVMRSLDRHEDDREHGDARGDRKCVGTQETCLRPCYETAQVTRVLPQRVRGLVDEWVLDPPVEALRGPDGGPVEERVVQLVEVELVLEHPLCEREARYCEPAYAVEEPRQEDAAETEEQRESRRHRVLPSLGADGRFRNRLEPVLDRVPEGLPLDPAADHGQDREDCDRYRERDADEVALQCMEVLAHEWAR